MIGKALTAVFGRRNDRIIKAVLPVVERVNALEPAFQALSDEALRAKSEAFRRRLGDRP